MNKRWKIRLIYLPRDNKVILTLGQLGAEMLDYQDQVEVFSGHLEKHIASYFVK